MRGRTLASVTQLFMVLPDLRLPDLQLGKLTTVGLGDVLRPDLRRATAADAESLGELMRIAYHEDDWGVERVHREFLDADDVPATWVIDEVQNGASKIIAAASERYLPDRYPGAGYLHFVAASPDHAGEGLGRVVTEQVLSQVAARGYNRCVLETDDFRKPALVTYLRLGFVPEYRSDAERLAWSPVFRSLLAQRTPAVTSPETI